MTFKQLQQDLSGQPDLQVCAAFLARNAEVLRTLFYAGINQTTAPFELGATEQDFDARDALLAFLNGHCGAELRAGKSPLAPVCALIIYFISLCERAGFHHLLLRLAQVLPLGSLRSRADAVFQYKNITCAATDYTARFQSITSSLHSAWHGASQPQQSQCEDFVIEYFCSASAFGHGIGEKNRTTLKQLFVEPANRDRYTFLGSPRILRILALPAERLAAELDDVNARIAEAFYDEAANLLPVPPQVSQTPVCAETGLSHGGHCPPGMHPAREAIAAMFPVEFANTNIFIKQPLTAAAYTEFNDTQTCMRYFRQYMPLHMPQIEQAVCGTIEHAEFQRKHLHVVDIGGGPGTLYVVLASLLHRKMFLDYKFDVTLVEPSKGFHEFLRAIAQHVKHPNLTIRAMHACTADELPLHVKRKDADWYFVANAITPIVKSAGTPAEAVRRLGTVIASTRRRNAPCSMTLAENTNSSDFPAVCMALDACGLHGTTKETPCPGAWLAGCRRFYVTGPMRPTQPRLKYAYIRIPEGYTCT